MQNSQIETNLESDPQQKEIYGSFHLGEGEYAIEADYIQEVVNLSNEYVRMPLAPDFLMGLYNLRGAIIPIIHLKKLFHFNPEESSNNEKLAILNYENCKVGFVFDSTGEILRTRTNIFSKIQYLSQEGKSVIKGVIEFKKDGRMIQVLDLPALLQQQSIPSFLSQQNLDKEKVFSKQFGANGSQKRCVSFCLGNSKFALDVESIKEITEVGSIENHGVTIHSETYLGMMELRGRTIPIINLKSLLGLKNYTQEKDFSDQEKRIIVVDIEGNYLGFLVESLESIIPYYSKELLAPYILNHNHPQMIEACIPRENDKNILLFNSTELFAIREVREAAVSHSRLFPPAEEKSSKRVLSNDIRSYLSFKVKGIFGVAIETVREIINFKAEEVSPAPAMPSFISGLLRLRNDVLYLVDLKDFLVFGKSKVQ